jgi:hypothetical protein
MPACEHRYRSRVYSKHRPLQTVWLRVSSVVKHALRRANIDSPAKGAHLLRHTAAREMLRNGVPLDQAGLYYLRMVNAVYAIDDFPGDALLWRIEWIGRRWLQYERSERPTNQHLPGAASRRPNGSAEREIPFLSNKENGENRRWPAILYLNCFGLAAA